MLECLRWFGPVDAVTLPQVAQTGATGVVTALHDIPYGEVWSPEAIEERARMITRAHLGLHWAVVESLPVHEDIKLGQGDRAGLFARYRQSLANLAAAGIRTVCYNFMPLLDWTRTDLAVRLPTGATALRFDATRMAAFEIGMVGRAEAEAEYPPEVCAAARDWLSRASGAERDNLLATINAGLPGHYPRHDLAGLRAALTRYDGLDRATLRGHAADFLRAVTPAAEDLGIRLCVHPDDPPRDLLGLPRIVSSAGDIAWLMEAVPSSANGLTLCTGSLGAGVQNDLPAIAARFADRIAFVHLRNVRRDPDGSFMESDHLAGDVDLIALLRVLLAESDRRRAAGADPQIPFRPDHGHVIGLDHGVPTHPGYPLTGRLRGLAELRGAIAALRAVAA
jgi:mannonate dehydratase